MYRLPAASTSTASGKHNSALVAGPPSPEKPACPLPATVLIVPLVSTLRIRWSPESAMYRLRPASTATPHGTPNRALVAGPPSPFPKRSRRQQVPPPATVLIIP